jgi:hypothetical protein
MSAAETRLAVQKLFVPSRPPDVLNDSIRKKTRWDDFVTWLQDIKWSKLNEEEYDSQWGACLNVMHSCDKNNIISREQLFPTFVQYLKVKKYTAQQIATLKSVSDKQLTFSIVSKAYMLMVGNVDHPSCVKTDRWLTEQIRIILERNGPPDDTTPDPMKRSRTIVDAKRDKCSEIIGDLQGKEDDRETDILQFLKDNNVAREYLDRIVERFEPRMHELQELLTTKDEQLQEAFRCYSRKEVKAMIAWYERLLEDVNTFRGVKQSSRKKIVRKSKPPEKVVARLKYLKHSDTLNISSVDPKKLVGSTQIWLYNTKLKKLIVYNASEQEKQMTVRGTAIVGWDPDTSFQKTLRKPEQQLATFQAAGKVALRNFMGMIKAKPQALRGRTNADMLILKIVH